MCVCIKVNEFILTFDMCKSTENATGAIACLLYIIAFCGFIDFRMKLLFRPSVTVLAIITSFTIRWLSPFLTMLYIGAWS